MLPIINKHNDAKNDAVIGKSSEIMIGYVADQSLDRYESRQKCCDKAHRKKSYILRSGHNYSIEESFNLTIPGPSLMRGLDLRLAEGLSLAYCDAQDHILFKDPSTEAAGHSAAVIDRAALSAMLAREELELIWVFTGEKSAHGGRRHQSGWGGQLEYWGIYRFSGTTISGGLNFEHKEPDSLQLEEFLARVWR